MQRVSHTGEACGARAPYYRYWAKTSAVTTESAAFHLLPYHLLDTAAVCESYLQTQPRMAKEIASIVGCSEQTASRLVCFFVGMHDIGKFAESFQSKASKVFQELRGRTPAKWGGVRHDVLSAALWRELLPEISAWFCPPHNGDLDVLNDALVFLYSASAGHHGKPADAYGVFLPDHFTQDDREAVRQCMRVLGSMFMELGSPLRLPREGESAFRLLCVNSWRLAGLTVLCDWVASNERFFPFVEETLPLEHYWHTHALVHAKSAMRATGIMPASAAPATGMKALFPSFSKATGLQSFAERVTLASSPQLFVIEDITGSGKTEAALVLAHRLMEKGLAGGLYFALPTMATANAMYERLAASYDRLYQPGTTPSLVLAHSGSRISDKFTESIIEGDTAPRPPLGEAESRAQCSAWLADNRKKALLAHVGVGTIDQALAAVLPAYHQSLRLFALQNNVLVVDEVHACDPYMHTLLQRLLEFQGALGGSAILLSASLPQKMRQQLVNAFLAGAKLAPVAASSGEYPLVTHVPSARLETHVLSREELRRRVSVQFVYDEESALRLLRQEVDRGACVCWMRNTVYDAVAAWTRLRECVSPEKITLFHARFVMGGRLEMEKRVRGSFGQSSTEEQRRGRVVVATQVVEQSLDLDFDMVLTDLAPIDRIIQRAGRLHRHQRADRVHIEPVLTVFSPRPDETAGENWYSALFPRGAYVYQFHGQLWHTAHELARRGGWRQPEDVRELIETVFAENAVVPPALRARDERANAMALAETSLARFNALSVADGYRPSQAAWCDDAITPTRLGDKSITLRLARWNGMAYEPWHASSRHPWDMSELRLAAHLIAGTPPLDNGRRDAMAAALDAMPDKGESCVVIGLEERKGRWRGKVLSGKGNTIVVEYSEESGLSIAEGDGDALQSD